MLKITMLQTPSVQLDGKAVSFPFKRVDALLYYMLVRRSATRQELISLLWESCDETTGLRNLRNTLYTLKKVLGGDFLLSPQKSLVVVNGEWKVDCDYDRFTRDGDFSAYRGPFLQGFAVKHAFSFDEWLNRTREKLHEQYLARLAELAREAAKAGDQEGAIRWATEYLREDPLDEAMTAFVMKRFRETRKFSRSAQVYQKLKERLSQELGVDPMESTTMLYYEIMNQWNDTQSPQASEQVLVPVGREDAFSALRASAASFGAGAARHCSLLFVGESGAGKSELIHQFLRLPGLPSFLTLHGDCLPSEEEVPLAPWDRLLLPVWDFVQSEGLSLPLPVRARLEQAFSVFREETGGPAPDQDARRALRQWDQTLEDSLLLLFSAVTRRKKVLLILEDLQWADPESLRLTDALLRRLEGGGLMAVFTCRESLRPDTRSLLKLQESDGLLRRQRLLPLTEPETRELLRRELGEKDAVQLAARFHRETGGNLCLLTELIQAWHRSSNVDATLQALDDILADRLSGLSREARHIAGLISIFQDGVPCRLLLELMNRDDRRLTAGLEELRERGIIEECRDSRDSLYRFVHQRIRELVYSQLSVYQRQPFHRQAAELLAGQTPPGEGAACRQIAQHFQLAQEPLRAVEYRIRALELDSARRCEPFALEGGEAADTTPEELEAEAQDCLRELSALRRAGQDPGTLARLEQLLVLPRGRLALFRGEAAFAADLLGSLSGASPRPDDQLLARCCYLLASLALYRQDASLAERYTITGRRLLESGSSPVHQALFRRLRGDCFCLQCDWEKSLYYYQEALDTLEALPRSFGIRLQLAAVFCGLGQVHSSRKDYVSACAAFKKALELSKHSQYPGAVWIYVHYGRTALLLDDQPKARELFTRGLESARATGEPWGRTAAAAYVARCQTDDGDYEQAALSLKDAQESLARLSSPLEAGILSYAGMYIRRALDLAQRRDSPLEALLPLSADGYARQGLRLLSGLQGVPEADLMSRELRDGITSQVRYRSWELYSKNKHFMSE